MKTAHLKQSRFELRISQDEKRVFERASKISGHKTLASFVTSIVKKRAKEIIDDHEKILVSEKDKEIFFNTILANNEPNEKLMQAAKKYSASQSAE
ncbi:DUF1778 domain-containing protein [Labilibaculum sp.]|uniref:type II toxin-antitoxin system TacA family antitoxin n=1 Tax=Labilibaculum sp. TaxID=2060723 RepID=UPI0035665537